MSNPTREKVAVKPLMWAASGAEHQPSPPQIPAFGAAERARVAALGIVQRTRATYTVCQREGHTTSLPGEAGFSLAPAIGRLRDDRRSNRSLHEDPAPAASFQLLDEHLFQALAQEALGGSGVNPPGGQGRWTLFCFGPVA